MQKRSPEYIRADYKYRQSVELAATYLANQDIDSYAKRFREAKCYGYVMGIPYPDVREEINKKAREIELNIK